MKFKEDASVARFTATAVGVAPFASLVVNVCAINRRAPSNCGNQPSRNRLEIAKIAIFFALREPMIYHYGANPNIGRETTSLAKLRRMERRWFVSTLVGPCWLRWAR